MFKAFASVQDMLLQIILNLGVSSAVHKRFKSCLSDRCQCVRIGTTGNSSAPVSVSYGILQGSVLSMFLFNIQLFQLKLSPKQSGKVEYERERLLGIANK
jgi:hypothetical protein